MLRAVHRGKELDALLGMLRSDDLRVRRATEAACALTRDLRHEAAIWEGVAPTEEQATEQRVRRLSVVARRMSVVPEPLLSMPLPAASAPVNRPEIASSPRARSDPYQFEALRVQMEHAETEHSEMASALRASQASEVALQQQLEDLRAQLRRARSSSAKRPELPSATVAPPSRDAVATSPNMPTATLLRHPPALESALLFTKNTDGAPKEKKAKSKVPFMKGASIRVAPKPATIVAPEAAAPSKAIL